ncbi:hypothetical protein [Nocardia alni]|uniref:hypothetical protein n=1 Tax=Nocardia alni TaxID=2815723 RepID=UPI001C2497D1|nr:hypothetical protein [Nocardia alni]
MKKRTTLLLVAAAATTMLTGLAAQSAQAAPDMGGDCAILGPIGANSISTLSPWQNEPQSQAAPQLAAYLGGLRAKEGGLHTAQGRADLDAYINALNGASSSAAAPQILAAINRLESDCPA